MKEELDQVLGHTISYLKYIIVEQVTLINTY